MGLVGRDLHQETIGTSLPWLPYSRRPFSVQDSVAKASACRAATIFCTARACAKVEAGRGAHIHELCGHAV